MPDLAYQSLAVLVLLLGLALLYWAMFRDRSRGRRRCPKCWYDLRGSDSLTCSECGYTAKRERQFFKTRRRWRWVGLVFVLLIGARYLWLVPKARRDGWLSIMPTTVVIAAFPYVGYDSERELVNRWADPDMSDPAPPGVWKWQVRWARHQASLRIGPNEGRLMRTTMFDFCTWCDPDAPIGDTLLAWLNDVDPQIQGIAATSFAGTLNFDPIDESVFQNRLCEMMRDPAANTRACAARGLSRFINENEMARSLLLQGLEDANYGVRSECAWSLRRLREVDASLLARLADLVRSRDGAAPAAAEALGAIGDASVIPALVDGIDTADFWLRSKCVASLVALHARPSETVSSLMALLENTDPGVRGAAIAALLRLNGVPVAEMDRIIAAIDVDATTEIISNLGEDQYFESEAIVPVLIAMVEKCPKSQGGSALMVKPYEAVIAMMARHPDQAEEMLPTILPMLDWPEPWARRAVIPVFGAFGARSAGALPQLRTMLEETTNPHEKELLRVAIASIEKDLRDRR